MKQMSLAIEVMFVFLKEIEIEINFLYCEYFVSC